jgi:hypothetical protein
MNAMSVFCLPGRLLDPAGVVAVYFPWFCNTEDLGRLAEIVGFCTTEHPELAGYSSHGSHSQA